MPYDTAADRLPDDQTHPWRGVLGKIRLEVNHERPAPGARTSPDDRREFVRPPHPKSLRQHGMPDRLRRQFLATLTAAGGDDRPAGAGAHPQAEAVRFGTPTVVRLEGPLAHGKAPSMSVVAEVRGPARFARSTTWRPLGPLYGTGRVPPQAKCPAVIAKRSP
jgi:hypothetical protein